MEFDRRIVEVHRGGRRPTDTVAAHRQRQPRPTRWPGDDRELERARPARWVCRARRFADRRHPGSLDERFDLDQRPLRRHRDAADLEAERSAHAERVGEIGDGVPRRAQLDPDALVIDIDHVDGRDGVRFHTTEWMPSQPNRKTCVDLVL